MVTELLDDVGGPAGSDVAPACEARVEVPGTANRAAYGGRSPASSGGERVDESNDVDRQYVATIRLDVAISKPYPAI